MTVKILIGDVREQLRLLPADHFDCVVTSPPYWGLRDYGTGRWEGGDPACAHVRVGTERTPWANSVKGPGNPGKNGSQYANLTKTVGGYCAKCEAVFADSQIGMETSLAEHIAVMVDVFDAVKRVLKPTGTLWLNYGDCYATSPNGRSAADTKTVGNDDRTFRDKPFSTIGGVLKAKDLCMIPNRLAIALQEAGWWVRSEIIWHKPNPMPESITDRPTTSHEKIWLLTKSERYFYDADSIREQVTSGPSDVKKMLEGKERIGGKHKTLDDALSKASVHSNIGQKRSVGNGETRNARNVWTMGTAAFSEAHFATFPSELAERCIKAGCPAGGHVLDPFGGAGTTGLVADRLQRDATLIELNPEYAALARRRIDGDAPLFAGAAE